MTRRVSDYFEAMDLIDAGVPQAEAARRTGIPRSTIRSWIERGPGQTGGHLYIDDASGPCPHLARAATLPAYAYLLGLYLGDGSISSHARGVYRLRITLASDIPGSSPSAGRRWL